MFEKIQILEQKCSELHEINGKANPNPDDIVD